MHTAHWKFLAAFTIPGLKPCWSMIVLILSALGCPRFLWILAKVCCSSLDKAFMDSWTGILSVWFVVESWSCSFEDSWMLLGIVLETLRKTCWDSCGGLSCLPCWSTASSDGTGSVAGIVLSGTFCVWSLDAGDPDTSRAASGLHANTVILTLQACEGRTLCLCGSSIHFSQSSSTYILMVPLFR